MLIYLSGSSDFLAGQTIKQIKSKYLAKNSNAELVELDETAPSARWIDLRSVPLFATSRLIIIRRAGLLAKASQEELSSQLMALPDSTVVVIWDGAKPASNLATSLAAAGKIIPLIEPVSTRELVSFLRQRTKQLGHEVLTSEQYQALITEQGSDLWALDSALFAFLAGSTQLKRGRKTTSENQFAIFRLIERADWPAAAAQLITDYQAGTPIELTIGSIASALRRSSIPKAKKLPVTELLSDLDFGLKTGLIEEEDAVALLSSHLSRPSEKRVQWEQLWEENN